MQKALSVMLLLAVSTAAAEPLLVSLDPLPYGAIQLAFNQYLIPNVGGMNVLLYSDAPLTFAQPGQTFTPKATLSLSPLPFGAVRMNDSQYMIPAVMPGVMALVVSATPLKFAASPLALQSPAASPAPAIAAIEAAKPASSAAPSTQPVSTVTTPEAPKPTPIASTTPEAPKPAPIVSTTPEVTQTAPLASTTPEAPKPAPIASTTPETPQPAPIASTTPEAPKSAPIASTAPEAPKPAPITSTTPEAPQPAPIASTLTTSTPRERGVDAALTTEVKASTRLPRLPGLPDDLTGSITITQHNNTVSFSYTLTSLGTTTYTLNPTALRLTQDGLGIRARLDRRNGNLTPGTLAPGKGEIGTITVNRTTSADVQLTWLITDNAGHTYTLTATTAQAQGALGVR